MVATLCRFRPKHVNMSNLIKAIYDSNLCTYYLLPLVRLNKFSFGPDNFIQCYTNHDGSRLYVELKDVPEFIYHRSDYLGVTILPTGGMAVALSLSDIWWEDHKRFILGQYSKFSEEAKKCIRAFSGLVEDQNILNEHYVHMDSRLIAIGNERNQRAKLRQLLSKELDVEIPVDAELISIPSESNFIDKAIITNTLTAGPV